MPDDDVPQITGPPPDSTSYSTDAPDASHAEGTSQQTSTSQQTEPASQSSQPLVEEESSRLWGCLYPLHPEKTSRIEFCRNVSIYTLGRSHENLVVLPSIRISNQHCQICFNEEAGRDPEVTVIDMSSNGTFINYIRLVKNTSWPLRRGDRISFAYQEDYQYLFYPTTGRPTERLIGRYLVVRELGRGAYGEVVLALNIDLNKQCALKIIDSKLTSSSVIQREIEIMVRLRHPNICEFIDCFVPDDSEKTHIVMEYVSGRELFSHLEEGAMTEHLARDITYQICKAVAYCHSLNIIHRDLKPENILLTSDVPPRVKLVDFGLAKVLTSHAMVATTCGTPWYIAPEIVDLDRHPYDDRVDSYSIGATVFIMLTGCSAFEFDDEPVSMVQRIASRKVKWDLIRGVVSPEAEDFVHQLLQNDPNDRMTITDALSHSWLASKAETQCDDSRSATNLTGHLGDDKESQSTLRATDSVATVVPLERKALLGRRSSKSSFPYTAYDAETPPGLEITGPRHAHERDSDSGHDSTVFSPSPSPVSTQGTATSSLYAAEEGSYVDDAESPVSPSSIPPSSKRRMKRKAAPPEEENVKKLSQEFQEMHSATRSWNKTLPASLSPRQSELNANKRRRAITTQGESSRGSGSSSAVSSIS